MKMSYHVFGWFGFAALLVLGYVGLLSALGALNGELSRDDVLSALGIVAAVLCLALAGLGVSLLWGVIRAIIPRRADPQDTVRPRLLALVISALLFPQFFLTLGSALADAGTVLLASLALPLESDSLQRLIDSSAPTPSLSQGVSALCQLLQSVGAAMSRFLGTILKPLAQTEAVRVYVVWLLVLLIYTQTPRNSLVPTESRWVRWKDWWLHKLKPRDRHHVYQGAVFLSGCYLSIAAMVAIPSLQKQGTETVVTKERLQGALQTATLAKEEFDRLYPEDFKTTQDPLSALSEFLASRPQVTPSSADVNESEADHIKKRWQKETELAEAALKEAQTQRRELLTRWQNYRREMSELQLSLSGRALSSFDIDTLTPLTTQERVLYFQDVVAWHRTSLEELQWALRNTLRRLDDYNSYLRQRATDFCSKLAEEQRWLNTTQVAPTSPDSALSFAIQQLRSDSEVFLAGRGAFEKPTFARSQPKPPEPGVFVGPFAFVARWLLRTRSFSLALITGMIGFGLFGASIASLVRIDATKLQEGDARNYATRAVMQGFSAAVVIFLAARGGLGLLAGGDNEPNGYALCFICLVGAVFSERVWTWAEERLRQTLTRDGSSPVPAKTAPSGPAVDVKSNDKSVKKD